MSTITYDLVQEIAVALKSTITPPVKDGIAYRIMAFKEKTEDRWVVGMIPDIVEVEELFMVINESYDKFLKGDKTPNGIVFLSAAQPEDLTTLVKHWYYGVTLTSTHIN